MQRGVADELLKYWNVRAIDLPIKGHHGWGFVKLEALFGPPGERFLVLDSDTVLTGPVLELWNDCGLHVIDDQRTSFWGADFTKALGNGDTKGLLHHCTSA